MSDPVYSPDGRYMWSGSEWIPSPPTSNTGKNHVDEITTLLDDLFSDENTEQKHQNLAIQDSVVMGDVTQIYNDEDAITTISESAIIEDRCSQIKSAVNTNDVDKIISTINSLEEYCDSNNNRLAKVEQLITFEEKGLMCSKIHKAVGGINYFHQNRQSHNIRQYINHYNDLMERAGKIHIAAIKLNNLSTNPNPMLENLHLILMFGYNLDCTIEMLDKIRKKTGNRVLDDDIIRDGVFELIIEIVDIQVDELNYFVTNFNPDVLGREFNGHKLEIKNKLETVMKHVRKAKTDRVLVSGLILFAGLCWSCFGFALIGEEGLFFSLAFIAPGILMCLAAISPYYQKNGLSNLLKALQSHTEIFEPRQN